MYPQAKLNAISPVPESEARTSVEFDFSALALPVPLEFADTDSLQDVPIDIFDDDVAMEIRDSATSNPHYVVLISMELIRTFYS